MLTHAFINNITIKENLHMLSACWQGNITFFLTFHEIREIHVSLFYKRLWIHPCPIYTYL